MIPEFPIPPIYDATEAECSHESVRIFHQIAKLPDHWLNCNEETETTTTEETLALSLLRPVSPFFVHFPLFPSLLPISKQPSVSSVSWMPFPHSIAHAPTIFAT